MFQLHISIRYASIVLPLNALNCVFILILKARVDCRQLQLTFDYVVLRNFTVLTFLLFTIQLFVIS